MGKGRGFKGRTPGRGPELQIRNVLFFCGHPKKEVGVSEILCGDPDGQRAKHLERSSHQKGP